MAASSVSADRPQEVSRMTDAQPEPHVNRYELTITAEAEVIKAEPAPEGEDE
ncbi:hypothetical protein GCM10010199_62170 [Dactylosporangium roseum]